jgi:hypothetical protein
MEANDTLVQAPDPNLLCPICINVLDNPLRTPCGHVFCGACISEWVDNTPACPECRTEVEPAQMLPDRFADRLVANLQSFCTFRKGGCQWVGKRGDMCGHLARECQMVIVACPHNCGTELPRGELWKHVETCAQAAQTDCPWGCGCSLGPAQMEVHKVECLMEPRKLVAALQKLHQENQRLSAENVNLRSSISSEDLNMNDNEVELDRQPTAEWIDPCPRTSERKRMKSSGPGLLCE